MLPLIFAGIAALSSVAGSAIKGSALSQQQKLLNSQLSDLESWYKRSRSEDLADSSALRNTLSKQQQEMISTNKAATSTISGKASSAESKIALASANNKKWGGYIADIAKNDSQNKMKIEENYLQRAKEITNQLNNIQSQSSSLGNDTINSVFNVMNSYKKLVE